jgi:outer membrane protein assembly factor BamB
MRVYSLLAIVVLLQSLAWADSGIHLSWRTPVKTTDPPSAKPAVTKDAVVLIYSQIGAYSQVSGRLLWQTQLHTYVPCSLVANRGVIFSPEETVTAVDAETGRHIWEFKPDANTSLGRATVNRGILYFGTASHRVYALRVSDKKQIWSIDLGPDWRFPAVVRGLSFFKGTLYVALEQWRTLNGTSASGWLVALSAKTGKVLWQFSTGSGAERRGLSSSPTITAKLILTGDYLSNAIVAVDRHSGKEVWRFQGKVGFVGFPEAPVVRGKTVYAGSGDTNVYALALSTGRELWHTKLPGANRAYALCGRHLLVNYGGLAALDPHTGHITQTLLDGRDEFVSSDIAVATNRAYVAGPKALYAFACE